MKYKLILILLIVMFIINSTMVYASAEDLNSLVKAIRDNSNVIDKISPSNKQAIIGLGTDFFNITRYSVLGYIILKAYQMIGEFKKTEDPIVINSIKNKATYLTLAAIITAQFWPLFKFFSRILNNINIL